MPGFLIGGVRGKRNNRRSKKCLIDAARSLVWFHNRVGSSYSNGMGSLQRSADAVCFREKASFAICFLDLSRFAELISRVLITDIVIGGTAVDRPHPEYGRELR
jgi:hypothetical protein